ncbi:hypothetical protein LTV02_09260 [Nocardia yamanashiensis]|uniref:hypothetical protein n=1 Tax=Nocardia yamanashiensis TaxID=209247 RepID=UPI001E3E8DA4|nr:hypothetical protein [Nocardia yamanashiensis]UGT43548.1 hypothetical protein LTV02_09260 [Nocardia yamanashiensis]
MNRKTGDPRERADLDDDAQSTEFADEHEAVTADRDPEGETESPDGLGGMDPDNGTAV